MYVSICTLPSTKGVVKTKPEIWTYFRSVFSHVEFVRWIAAVILVLYEAR